MLEREVVGPGALVGGGDLEHVAEEGEAFGARGEGVLLSVLVGAP